MPLACASASSNGLHFIDVNLREGTLHLRYDKGGRPRVVPLGRNATHWLQRYLDEVRPWLVRHRPFELALFVVRGGRMLRQYHIPASLLKQYCGIAPDREDRHAAPAAARLCDPSDAGGRGLARHPGAIGT